MINNLSELEKNLPKECCSFCTHLSLEGPDENYKYDIKCVVFDESPRGANNCNYFEAEYCNLNHVDLDGVFLDYLEACLRVPYDEYIKTVHWKLFKEYALNSYNNRCPICGSSEGLDVFHTSKKFGRETLDDVKVICCNCSI